MKTAIAIAAIGLLACALPALADDAPTTPSQNWKVSEGVGGSTKGIWTMTITDNGLVGQSQMTTIGNQPLGYKLSGTVTNGAYALQTTSSSDGSICSYSGQLAADGVTIQGSQACGSGSAAPWVALTQLAN